MPFLRRFCLSALALLPTIQAAHAQQDLIVRFFTRIPSSTYRNVTIQRGGYLSLDGPLTVTGAIVVQAGGVLGGGDCYPVIGPGSFELQADGQLAICQAEGITRTAAAGAIQVTGTRTYSPQGLYLYIRNTSPAGAVTGDGLPATVKQLVMAVGARQLTLTNDVTVRQWAGLFGLLHLNGHRLTLASSSDGSAYLTNVVDVPGINPGPGGTVAIQRYIAPGLNPGLGYRHLSVPLAGQTVTSLGTGGPGVVVNPAYNSAAVATRVAPFPTVFSYDERRLPTNPATDLASFDKGWVSPAALGDALVSGRGYTVQASGGQILEWQGEIVTGNVTVPLTRTGGAEGGWHLVGNPYPGPLNWSRVTIPTGMSGAMYVYESTAQYGGRYRSYVNGVGNPIVPLGQGFFVRVTTTGAAPTLAFTNSARVNNGVYTSVGFDSTAHTVPVYRTAAVPSTDPRPLLHLTLGNAVSSLSDEAYVYFEAGATAGVDDAYDAVKIQHSTGGAPTICTQAADTEMSINGLPTLTSNTVVPLSLDLPAAGSYTVRAAELRNLSTVNVYLHDAVNGQDIDLQQQGSYRFNAAAGPLTGRFELRINPARPTAAQPILTAASISVYPNPARHNFAMVVPAVVGAWQVQATLLNTLGQVVRQQTSALPAAGARLAFDVTDLPVGIYSVRLQAGEAVAVKRIVLE